MKGQKLYKFQDEEDTSYDIYKVSFGSAYKDAEGNIHFLGCKCYDASFNNKDAAEAYVCGLLKIFEDEKGYKVDNPLHGTIEMYDAPKNKRASKGKKYKINVVLSKINDKKLADHYVYSSVIVTRYKWKEEDNYENSGYNE